MLLSEKDAPFPDARPALSGQSVCAGSMKRMFATLFWIPASNGGQSASSERSVAKKQKKYEVSLDAADVPALYCRCCFYARFMNERRPQHAQHCNEQYHRCIQWVVSVCRNASAAAFYPCETQALIAHAVSVKGDQKHRLQVGGRCFFASLSPISGVTPFINTIRRRLFTQCSPPAKNQRVPCWN